MVSMTLTMMTLTRAIWTVMAELNLASSLSGSLERNSDDHRQLQQVHSKAQKKENKVR